MPFQSRAQAGWAFATGQPFAKRWARQTGPYKRLPYKKRKKSFTLAQLEAFVSSEHYDADTAGAIAAGIPAFKTDGELISPGIRRIHGNLCNVHGRYGPCDKALSGKKKPAKGRKPAKTDAQRAAERAQHQTERQTETTRQQALNLTKVADATGLGDNLANLDQFSNGKPIRPQDEETLIKQGVMERGTDGAARVTEQGRVLLNAAKRGDTQRARDALSRGRDQVSASATRTTARQERARAAATRTQGVADRRAAAQAKREQAKREQAKRKPAKAAAGGSKQPATTAHTSAPKPKRATRQSAPSVGSIGGSSSPKPAPKPKPPAPKAPVKQIAPALTEAAQSLSDGKELSDDDTQALIRNGLARLVKGELILTAAGQRQTTKAAPTALYVFKDSSGNYRWVAQSSTAFQDRDREIVSTKALADDCAFADTHNAYGPLRWWHSPGLDLGDCDFNAMHGRVLIESGTFRSPQIAQKVAAAASGLEISLGFIHLPSEPDADGVFHHIRRFERSLVPRGKASNRFTAFTVKETRMPSKFTPEKIQGLKAIGFTDEEIAGFSDNANATEKTADDALTAFKADEPVIDRLGIKTMELGGITYELTKKADEPTVRYQPGERFKAANGDEYVKSPSELDPTGMYYATKATKAFPPAAAPVEGSPEEEAAESPEEEAAEPDAMADDAGGLTLSPEDLTAMRQASGADEILARLDTLAQALDLVKTMSGHIDKFGAVLGAQQTTKDAEVAQTKVQLTELTTKVNDLMGDQPAAPYRASAARDNVLTDATMLAAAKQLTDPNAADPWADIKQGLGLSRPQ